MESKNENDLSAETCMGRETQSEAEMIACFKSRTCEHPQHTASDASNLLSASSTKDSPFENVESTTGFSHKSDSTEFPSTKDIANNLQNSQVLHSHAESSNECISPGDSKGLKEKSSFQNKAKPSNCSTEQVGSMTNDSIDEWKPPARDSASILPNNHETLLQSQTTEGLDIEEEDIKVCDICGDAGREEMLAVCSRCSDGAEHTYCMRIRLDKVPESDWLCEECQLKENAEKQELDKMKTVTGSPREPSLKEKVFGGTLHPKPVPKLDGKANEVEADKASKVTVNSLLSAKRHADNHADSLKSRKLAAETAAGASGMVSPCKNPSLSRENSSKSIKMGKLEQANPIPLSRSLSTNNSKEAPHSLSSMGPNSSKMQAQSKPPHDLLSRSATFNSLSSKPKVKQLLGDALQKQMPARKSSSIVTRKEGFTTKSMSFRKPTIGHSNSIEPNAKMQSSNLYSVESPEGSKETKGQPLLERRNSSKMNPLLVSSAVAGTSMPPPNADPKSLVCGERTSSFSSENNSHDPNTPQCDGKLNPFNPTRGSERVLVSDGCDEVKKQSCFPSGFRVPISKGKPHSSEWKAYQVGLKEDQAASSCVADEACANPDAVLQSGKHIAQSCVTSSLRVSAFKPSAANSGEMSNKSNKWKDAVEAISMSRNKERRLPGQSDELFLSSTGLNGDTASKDQLSSSLSSVRSLPSLEGTSDGQETLGGSMSDPSRTIATVHVGQDTVHSMETACAPREANSVAVSTNSDEFKLKPYTMEISTQASVPASLLRIPAIPEHDYIWQGSFVVQRSGRLSNYYDGIQAHMSTCSSHRVLDVVKKFSYKVQLEEVPRLSSWPMQFQRKATEDNIALYFFAKDLQSYERSYKKLLDRMLKNDLALKGNVDGTEFLIFPSDQLPEKSQYWNRLFFLWAVFRERRVTCSKSPSSSPKKLHGTSLNVGPSVHAPVVAEGNKSQKTGLLEPKDKELSMHDNLPEAPEAVDSNSVDFPFLSYSQKGDKNCCAEASSLSQRPINFHEHDQSATNDTHSSEKQSVCSIPEIHSSDGSSQLPTSRNFCSLSNVSVTNQQMPKAKDDSTSLKNVCKDSGSVKDAQLQPRVQPTIVQNGVNEGMLETLDPDDSSCRQAGLSSSAADGRDMSFFSSKMPPVSSSSLLGEAGSGERLRLMNNTTYLEEERWEEPIGEKQSCWELSSSRKRLLSNIPDVVSETSGKSLNETIRTMAWNEKPYLQVDSGNNCKKMRNCSDVNVQSSSHEQNVGDGFSRKLLDLDLNSLDKEQKGVYASDDTIILENSQTIEKYLFPADAGHVRDLKSGTAITQQIPSSDDEELPDADVPNLDLALGAEKKQPNRGALHLFGQLRSENYNPNKFLDSATDDGGDDLSASLSLSLSFPSSEKERPSKSVPKAEHLLPKRQHVNTSSANFFWL